MSDSPSAGCQIDAVLVKGERLSKVRNQNSRASSSPSAVPHSGTDWSTGARQDELLTFPWRFLSKSLTLSALTLKLLASEHAPVSDLGMPLKNQMNVCEG